MKAFREAVVEAGKAFQQFAAALFHPQMLMLSTRHGKLALAQRLESEYRSRGLEKRRLCAGVSGWRRVCPGLTRDAARIGSAYRSALGKMGLL